MDDMMKKMNIKKINLIYFSPTKTTKTVLESIASGFGAEMVNHIDLTTPAEARKAEAKQGESPRHKPEGNDGKLAVFGAPVYGGRIPAVSVDRFRGLHSDGTPAVIVAVYGNREFEDALVELNDLAQEAGFRPIAAAAFIGEHSFADEKFPIALNRPDDQDREKAVRFGRSIKEKIASLETIDQTTVTPPTIPGDRPYKERGKPGNIAPEMVDDKCTLCGKCAEVCPTGAISVDRAVETDASLCIKCCACIKMCPENARYFDDDGVKKAARWLWENYNKRKEPELFLPD